jgi:hypothetical protein
MTFNVLIFFWRSHSVENFDSFSSQKYFWRSDFTYGVKKDQNVESLICLIFEFRQSDFTYGVSTYGVLAQKTQS